VHLAAANLRGQAILLVLMVLVLLELLGLWILRL